LSSCEGTLICLCCG